MGGWWDFGVEIFGRVGFEVRVGLEGFWGIVLRFGFGAGLQLIVFEH